ncbi:hypothetical protein EVG20_g335 [Dentipellis fragilis]|uniref:Uncharacterized protein n=1 Tax=Dentipellis fragilis TaxID=205917 RepID=A0A4Y9ZF89_9AGAM|nr:hypothetical protein EVG20_g335 [Dentipellis fragilis]
MLDEMELKDLSATKATEYDADSDTTNTDSDSSNPSDNTVAIWCWVAASILSLWSALLILSPRLLLFAAEEGQTPTPLESFLALHFGILLAGTALSLVLYIPSALPVPTCAPKGPPIHPLLVPLTSVTLLSSFLSYNTSGAGGLPIAFALCTGTIGIWGLWTVTFAGTSLISKKTGADKHTSAFIFGNKSAASVQKKQWKKEQKVKGR